LWLGANTNYRLIGFPINMLLAVTRYNVHSVEIKQELQEKFQGGYLVQVNPLKLSLIPWSGVRLSNRVLFT